MQQSGEGRTRGDEVIELGSRVVSSSSAGQLLPTPATEPPEHMQLPCILMRGWNRITWVKSYLLNWDPGVGLSGSWVCPAANAVWNISLRTSIVTWENRQLGRYIPDGKAWSTQLSGKWLARESSHSGSLLSQLSLSSEEEQPGPNACYSIGRKLHTERRN